MEPTLTWPGRLWMWGHFVAIILFVGGPLFGNVPSGVIVGVLSLLFGIVAMTTAQVHAGLWDDMLAEFA